MCVLRSMRNFSEPFCDQVVVTILVKFSCHIYSACIWSQRPSRLTRSTSCSVAPTYSFPVVQMCKNSFLPCNVVDWNALDIGVCGLTSLDTLKGPNTVGNNERWYHCLCCIGCDVCERWLLQVCRVVTCLSRSYKEWTWPLTSSCTPQGSVDG